VSDFRKDEVALMCDVSELIGLFDSKDGLDAFLQQAVSKVAWHMRAAVCSIYLYDPSRGDLVLKANQGLSRGMVGTLRLKLDNSSLTGRALLEGKPVRVGDSQTHPQFLWIQGLGEEGFHGFLAVPILRYMRSVGVIVVQDPQRDYFTEHDEQALKVIAAQLAGVIENAGALLRIRGGGAEDGGGGADAGAEEGFGPGQQEVRGQGASGSVGVGLSARVGRFVQAVASVKRPEGRLDEGDFDRAVAATDAQLLDLQRQLESKLHDAASMIFGAHVLMLRDEAFSGKIRERIRAGEDAWEACTGEIKAYAAIFERSQVAELQEKVLDVEDLGHRLLANLANKGGDEQSPDYRGRIVIAEELRPSDILKLAAEGAEGLVLLSGGQHSHVAILAKALRLPLVIARDERLMRLPERTLMVMDGKTGLVMVRPGEEAEKAARRMVRDLAEAERVQILAKPETRTRDGARVHLRANLNLVHEIGLAKKAQAEGVGLYRTEFPFIVRNSFPSEDEQYLFYKAVLDEMRDRPVVFRTLDIGGDKALSYYPSHHELNPSLGLRALRFSFRNLDIFRQQLRALVRAAAGAPRAKVMFPLVASLEEFDRAKRLAAECVEELRAAGVAARLPELGVMVELPATVGVVEELAREVDFLSIGSNDLIQYLLAVDRTNEEVAAWYAPRHPAVLRALARIVRAGDAAGKEVSLCGDLATDADMMPFLIGIGLRNLSMDPAAIPRVQESIEAEDAGECAALAERLLGMSRGTDIEAALKAHRPAGGERGAK
jgi:phosphotransferase system enzyme I (PtsP)